MTRPTESGHGLRAEKEIEAVRPSGSRTSRRPVLVWAAGVGAVSGALVWLLAVAFIVAVTSETTRETPGIAGWYWRHQGAVSATLYVVVATVAFGAAFAVWRRGHSSQ